MEGTKSSLIHADVLGSFLIADRLITVVKSLQANDLEAHPLPRTPYMEPNFSELHDASFSSFLGQSLEA